MSSKQIHGDFYFSLSETKDSLDITKKRLKKLLIDSNIFYEEDGEIVPYSRYLKEKIVIKDTNKKGEVKYKIKRLFIWKELTDLKNQCPDIADWRVSVKTILSYDEKLQTHLGKMEYFLLLQKTGLDGINGLIEATLVLIFNNINIYSADEQKELKKHFLILSKNKTPYRLKFINPSY